MHEIPRLFKHKSMDSKHKTEARKPSTSNLTSFDSPDSPICTRSLDTSINDRTSFRIEGIDGEFDMICQSLGLSGPDDFAIPAADWESRKLRSSSDILPRSRLNKLDRSFRVSELSVKFSEKVNVSGRDRDEVHNESVRVNNVDVSDRDEVDNEFVRVGNDRGEVSVRIGNGNVGDRAEVDNEFVRVSNVRGINGVRPPVLMPPLSIALPVIDDNSSTWDILRPFAPDGDENNEFVYGRGGFSSDEDGGGGNGRSGESERNVVSEDNMFTTSNEDDSSSTMTEPPSNVSFGSVYEGIADRFGFNNEGKTRPIISSWEKGKLLGRGSLGSVYEGITDGGFFLAVKEVSLLDQGVQGRQSITQLEQEIDLLSKLEHENIVQYLGTEQTESNLYIFLELASKGSLMSLYQQYHLQDSQVSVYTRQILNGLKYLHGKNVVHRDIKSANILVDTNGTAKLADFGLAKATKLNDVQSCKGTAFWMAPEVVKRSQGYGLAADIWSLGCTVLELLTRQLPYHPLDGMQALYRIGNNILPQVPDSLSKEARDFILRCLQVDPSSRPTAAQLLDHSFVKRSFQYREIIPCQGKSRQIISSWEKGKLLGCCPFGSVYEGISEMEVLLDFHKSEGTLLDITELFGLLEKIVQYEFLKSKSVAVRSLKVIYIRNSKVPEIPDNLSFPDLEELYLQSNLHMSCIPSSFFKQMPALKVLDMSNTSLKTLPPAVSELFKLEQLNLQHCELLMELPPEIGALRNLKVLDLEGTDLVCLPDEVKELTNLKCLKFSLYDAESYRKSKKIVAVIPAAVLSKLTQLEELSINVDPQDVWCCAAMKATMEDLPSLRKLKTLKLYLPTTELLKDLVKLKWNYDDLPIYQNLSNFNVNIGPRAQRFMSRLPCDLEEEFLKLKKCLNYINGEDDVTQFAEALKHANALYLDRHWTIKKLSTFNLEESNELKFCLLVDCNEMEAIFDGSDFSCGVVNKGENILPLQYLAIHYLKNLEVIWKGPGVGCCSHILRVLALHMCPNLTTVFTPVLLEDLHNLKEIIVEDCPKITNLVSEDSTWLTSKETLPRLKKLSLFYLPGLVSISSSLSIGPELENIVIYDCPKLKRLPSLGVCSKEVIEIKGESEWWNALEWNEPEWNDGQPHYLQRAFSELDTNEDCLDEWAPQYGNSLRVFVEECDANEHGNV